MRTKPNPTGKNNPRRIGQLQDPRLQGRIQGIDIYVDRGNGTFVFLARDTEPDCPRPSCAQLSSAMIYAACGLHVNAEHGIYWQISHSRTSPVFACLRMGLAMKEDCSHSEPAA